MVSEPTLRELARIQHLLLALLEDLDEETLRRQMHPDLSALGWHLGHCTYVECYWLHEVVRGDDSVTRPLQTLYVPPHTPKPQRGQLIPDKDTLLRWAQGLQVYNQDWLAGPALPWSEHPLMREEYLVRFLIQHHAQHYETMLMALTQRQLHRDHHDYHPHTALHAEVPDEQNTEYVPAGHYRIGGKAPDAFDNELPQQQAELGEFRIARRPLSNAQYLAFMEDGGYRRDEFWSDAGTRWRATHDTAAPNHWRCDSQGNWYGIGLRGPYDLPAEDPVMGINHHEAGACARWAGARLPHEYQWETAQRLQLLQHTGRVWEWCDNPFMPYAGFQAFPYEEYSRPWFDEKHFSLRGGSLYTQPGLKRASFRNFYEADKRHIFAGIRLIY